MPPGKTWAGQVKELHLPLAICGMLLFRSAAIPRPLTVNPRIPPQAIALFRAAEEAQNHKDYATAEIDYRAVIRAAPRFAPAYLNLGLIAQARDQRTMAVKLLGTAARLNPSLFGAQFFLGLDECLRGEPRPAISHLKAALRLRPDYAKAYTGLSTAQKMTGDLDGAARTLIRGLRSKPGNPDMLYLLGRIYEALGRESIDRIEKTNPHSSYVEQWLAEEYARSGYSAAAVIHFENAIAASPERKHLHLELGELYLEAGNAGRALDEFNAELQLNPSSLAARVRRGEAELLEGDVSKAMTGWRQALARDPSRVARLLEPRDAGATAAHGIQLPASLMPRLKAAATQLENFHGAVARAALGFIFAQEGHPFPDSAIEEPGPPQRDKHPPCTPPSVVDWLKKGQLNWFVDCRHAAARIALQPDVRAEFARALFIEGYPREALRALSASSAADETAPSLYYWRARCYKTLAVRTYSKLLRVAPNSYRSHELLGNIAMARHQDAAAIQDYEEALEQSPELPDLHYEIGHLLWKNFKVSDARKEFESELRLNPRNSGALLDMGGTYLYEHRPAHALPFLSRAETLQPANPTVHEFLGTAYFQLHKYALALAELEKAAPSDKDGRVHYQIGKVFQALGRKKDAEKEFAAATAITLATHRKSEERVDRLNAAGSSLKQH